MKKVKKFYYLRPQILMNMFLTILFISGGEIFIILLFVLIFFGADKIPEFTRMMGKGVREFRKATDDIKREFHQSSSGVLNEIKSVSEDLKDNLTRELAEPVQKSMNETAKTFDDFQDRYGSDFYYENQYDIDSFGNEYHNEQKSEKADEPISEKTDEPISEKTDEPEAPLAPADS